jgi:hypothetical protein
LAPRIEIPGFAAVTVSPACAASAAKSAMKVRRIMYDVFPDIFNTPDVSLKNVEVPKVSRLRDLPPESGWDTLLKPDSDS